MDDPVDEVLREAVPVPVAPSPRPRVITHNLASVDGRLALSPEVVLMNDERWPVYEESPYAAVRQRHHPQVLLEGSGSLAGEAGPLEDLPAPTEDEATLRTDHLPPEAVARAHHGWFTVVDSRGRVRWGFKEMPGEEWAGWHLLVLVSRSTPLPYLSFLRSEGIPYAVAGELRVDLEEALVVLQDLFGVTTVVSTGGGRLNGALLRAGLVDEIEVEVLPMAVGGTTTSSLFMAPDLYPTDRPVPLRLLEVAPRSEGRVLLRYEVLRQTDSEDLA